MRCLVIEKHMDIVCYVGKVRVRSIFFFFFLDFERLGWGCLSVVTASCVDLLCEEDSCCLFLVAFLRNADS